MTESKKSSSFASLVMMSNEGGFMRNVILALGSFTLGAASMSVLGGPQALPVLRAQSINIPYKTAIPQVPPLEGTAMLLEGEMSQGTVLHLDGKLLHGSTYFSPTIVYGGGAYELLDSTISGPVKLQLVGAAANTAQLLATFGFLGTPPSTSPPSSEKHMPIEKTTTVKTSIRGDFVAPYDGKK
jgi:hypothetical protein